MGSKRSGKHGRSSYPLTTEDTLVINISSIIGKGENPEGRVKLLYWSHNKGITLPVEVKYEENSVRLSYTFSRYGIHDHWHSYTTPITWTKCNFGGKRPWFICRCCNRRVANLYLNRSYYFFCRQCGELVYESQYEDEIERKIRKAQKVRKQLGWETNIFKPQGGRPKHMHWATYNKKRFLYRDLAEDALYVWKLEAGLRCQND